ncbi:hypothetical protein V8E51_012297 [Hyaloscypha variabilis]
MAIWSDQCQLASLGLGGSLRPWSGSPWSGVRSFLSHLFTALLFLLFLLFLLAGEKTAPTTLAGTCSLARSSCSCSCSVPLVLRKSLRPCLLLLLLLLLLLPYFPPIVNENR